tara:strand:+ start:269 stop:1078 length:810 start_codon:yes stop_codon:yes gene_type:complete
MKIFLSKNRLIKYINSEKNLGFVPTMGSIHSGHISLIKKSISQCNKTIVTIFINKPQFNHKKDFKKYPRNFKKDKSILKKLKVDYLYIPQNREIYPKGPNKKIKINKFKNKLCGKTRPGHFKAVVDVVDRFIKIIKPKRIYFGEKDMQQLKIVEDFIKKNHPSTKVISCKIIREKNGIAYSSRNLLLSKKEKEIASKIYYLLRNNKKKLILNGLNLKKLKKNIISIGANKIDYIQIFDINKIIKPFKRKKVYKVFVAYYLRTTRLIDNI